MSPCPSSVQMFQDSNGQNPRRPCTFGQPAPALRFPTTVSSDQPNASRRQAARQLKEAATDTRPFILGEKAGTQIEVLRPCSLALDRQQFIQDRKSVV